MTLDEILYNLEEVSLNRDESENELLDENMPLAKTSKKVAIYISPMKNGDITDKDPGVETNFQLSNLRHK